MANKDKKMLTLQGSLEGISTLKDKALSLRFHTQELPSIEQVVLMNSVGKFGYLLWAEDVINLDDVPEQNTDVEGRKIKTPSQRLRNVLYIEWRDTTDQSLSADEYYIREMEKMLTERKRRLPE